MTGIRQFIGHEYRLDELARAIRTHVQAFRAPVVGAMHVTCCDEAEQECAQAFEQGVVADLLPALKAARRSCFRIANAGGRYEWGMIGLAEQHYAIRPSRDAFKVMVVKLNAHVSVEDGPEGPRYGRMERYHEDSVFCGALHAALDFPAALPVTRELADVFASEGLDRAGMLNDPSVVPPDQRSLFVAVAAARLQARRVVQDIQDERPHTPTVFLVFPSVTLNRHELDTELLCGVYEADARASGATVTYTGLGDDPSIYRAVYRQRRIAVTCPGMHESRHARDHRRIIAEAEVPVPTITHPEWRRVLARMRNEEAPDAVDSVLRDALDILETAAPTPAALALFGCGAVGMNHVDRAHRLCTRPRTTIDARILIEDARNRFDSLGPEVVARTLRALAERFTRP